MATKRKKLTLEKVDHLIYALLKNATKGGCCPFKLTRRQIQVLHLFVFLETSKQVARAMRVAKRTVDYHLANIYARMDVHNRAHAIILAFRWGVIRISDK